MVKFLKFVVVVMDVFSANWRVLICQKQFSLAFSVRFGPGMGMDTADGRAVTDRE